MAKDRSPQDGRAGRGGSDRSGGPGARGSSGSRAATSGRGGRTRPPAANVVAQQRPWGLIAAAVAVVVFAAAVIGYAVVQVNRAEASRVDSVEEIGGVQSYQYEAAQHVSTPVDYEQSPPVGGPHDIEWADCTGTVYDVPIRQENAVHSLEHGAVWITYDPERVGPDQVTTLAELVDGEAGRMLSPNPGQEAPVSLQSWGHQLAVDSVDDPRIAQFADFLTFNAEFFPEPGATCENPQFVTDPLTVDDESRTAGLEQELPGDVSTPPAETGAP